MSHIQFVSHLGPGVVPKGPLGQAVMSCQELSPLLEITGLCDVEGDLGIFTVLPEIKSVHYQRTAESWNMLDLQIFKA